MQRSPHPSSPTFIAMLLRWESAFERGVRSGAQRHIVLARHMRVLTMGAPDIRLIRYWGPVGIIAHITDSRTLRNLVSLKIPIVDTAGITLHPAIATVSVDAAAIGAMAADHFTSRGIRSFACYHDGRVEPLHLCKTFERAANKAGFDVIQPPVKPRNDPWSRRHHESVIRWLGALPKPIGIFAPYDDAARWLLGLCQLANYPVPDDIAVLGVGDDEWLCHDAYPPLSSVRLPAAAVGMEAARVLERLIAGRRGPRRPLWLGPDGVTVRQSTDQLAVHAPDVAEARRMIHQKAAEPINVKELAKALALSRRALERHFRDVVGHTLLEEIHRVKAERAKQLLLHTDLSVAQVAAATGLRDSNQLRRLFQAIVGLQPSEFRKSRRAQ